ncbi:hypothetical protein BAE44_0000233, partial [Dichanthelium oligosanthes]
LPPPWARIPPRRSLPRPLPRWLFHPRRSRSGSPGCPCMRSPTPHRSSCSCRPPARREGKRTRARGRNPRSGSSASGRRTPMRCWSRWRATCT